MTGVSQLHMSNPVNSQKEHGHHLSSLTHCLKLYSSFYQRWYSVQRVTVFESISRSEYVSLTGSTRP